MEMRLFVILAFLCALGLSFSSFVEFIVPSSNDSRTNATFIELNASATQLDSITPLTTFNWSWNGSDSVLYDSNLVAMYDFDNLSDLSENDNLAVDTSQYGNNLTCDAGNCPIWDGSGRYYGAFTFDGTNDMFNATKSTSLESQTLTLESWMYIDSSPGIRSAIISYGYGTTAGGPIDGSGESYSLSYQNDISSFRFRLKDFAGANLIDLYSSSSTPIAQIQNQWVHVLATWDGTTAKIYKNGVQILSGSNPGTINYIADSNATLRIGNWFGNDERWFKGKLDAIRIYNRSMNSTEVLQHYYSNLRKNNSTGWVFYSNQSDSDEGTKTYRACMNDSANDLNCTTLFTANVDRSAPVFNSYSPVEGYNTSDSNVYFYYNVSDNLASYLGCYLYIDGALTASSGLYYPNTNRTFNYSSLSDGNHNWSINCVDYAGNDVSTPTRNFTLDTNDPSISVISPANNSEFLNSTIAFVVNVTDSLSPTFNCSLYLGGSIVATNSSVLNSNLTTFTHTISRGSFPWYLSCSDS